MTRTHQVHRNYENNSIPRATGWHRHRPTRKHMNRARLFFREGHWPTLLSAFLYFDVSFMIWVMLGALGNYIAADFGLSPAQKGLMAAIPLLGGSILRLVFGHLTDTIGAKK